MKILVPTDFSECSTIAFNAAAQISKKMGADLILYHNISLPETWTKSLEGKDQLNAAHNYLRDYAAHELYQLVRKADCQGSNCSTELSFGKLRQNIEDYENRSDIDLIVMGSHGSGGKNEWFLGSNAQQVVRDVEKNTLIIKKPWPKKMKNVAFVTDISIRDQPAFVKFLKFVDYFQPEKIYLLCIDTDHWLNQPKAIMDQAFKDFIEIAKGYNCESSFYRDYSVDSGVRNFTKENKIDLLAMANHHTNPLKRFFLGSNLEMIVNHSNVSVLSIDA